MSEFVIKPIGRIRTPYGQKFAVPRQPGLAPAACEIELFKPYCDPQAVVGLEGFSHIHVIFVFDQEPEQDTFRPMVRPPRLGGNQRVGVFACRSPNRPNRLGLSVLKLTQIENRNGRIVLHVEGADMVDNTPIIDLNVLPTSKRKPTARTMRRSSWASMCALASAPLRSRCWALRSPPKALRLRPRARTRAP